MNITTIIELENGEVENLAGAKLIFTQDQIAENIVESCVECFKVQESEEILSTEEGMEKVFNQLKKEGVVPANVVDFSFEMPSCGYVKSKNDEIEVPQKVILTFMS